MDYAIDILGGSPAVLHASEYGELDGITVPSCRPVDVRDADGSSVRDLVSIAIDVTDVTSS